MHKFGILIFMILRSPCKNVKPYNNPFWVFNNGGKKKNNKKKIPKIVATFVYASSQGQRTHSAQTKISEPYDIPYWEKSNTGRRERKREEKKKTLSSVTAQATRTKFSKFLYPKLRPN